MQNSREIVNISYLMLAWGLIYLLVHVALNQSRGQLTRMQGLPPEESYEPNHLLAVWKP